MKSLQYTLWLIFIITLVVSCDNNNPLPGGSGFVEATDIIISSEVSGRLEKIYFDEGDRIETGDTIGMIDTVITALRLAGAKASYQAALSRKAASELSIKQASINNDLALKEFERIKTLIKSGSVNQQQYDKAENTYTLAELAKSQAKVTLSASIADLARIEAETALLAEQLNDCFPVSPETGIVIDKYINAGELATIGKPLIKIARLDEVWVKVYLPPSDLTGINLGGEAKIDPEDGRDAPMTGKISWISDEAEFTPKNVQTKQARADLVYAVKITIINNEGRLKMGMPVQVIIK
jgi:membrane fusion protein YbhG